MSFTSYFRSARMNIVGTLVLLLSVLFPLISGRIGDNIYETNRVSNFIFQLEFIQVVLAKYSSQKYFLLGYPLLTVINLSS